MSSDTIEVRVLLRHYWKKGLSVRKAADEINEVEGITSKSAAGRWFQRFNDGDLSLEDKPRSGRPTKLDNEDLIAVLGDRRFESFDEVEEACQEFFDSKPKEWYFDQIRNLADRWQKVVENDGLYFEE
jgi:transposase